MSNDNADILRKSLVGEKVTFHVYYFGANAVVFIFMSCLKAATERRLEWNVEMLVYFI